MLLSVLCSVMIPCPTSDDSVMTARSWLDSLLGMDEKRADRLENV